MVYLKYAICCLNNRYGREEMLALFVKEEDVPGELLKAPNIISEDALVPLSLIPLSDEDQVQNLSIMKLCTFNRLYNIGRTYSLS